MEFAFNIFTNKNNGYSVNTYSDIETGKTITCCGYNLPAIKNVEYDFTTEETNNKKFGKQYNVLSYTVHVSKDKKSIIKFLSSGVIKGIGEKTAERIFERFGIDTLDVLDAEPDKLAEIKGISQKKCEKIKKSYIENRAALELSKVLTPCGFTMSQIGKIFSIFKSNSMDTIKNEPYKLCDVNGVTFDIVDNYAMQNGFTDDYPERIRAASRQVLADDLITGNVCMELNDFAEKLIALLHAMSIPDKKALCPYVVKMIKDHTIIYRKLITDGIKIEYIYLPYAYEAESRIAEKISVLIKNKITPYDGIDKILDAGNIKLDDKQKKAVKSCFTYTFSVVTGGPGTGKTTILKKCVDVCKANNRNVILLSPTGRAARKMTESTNESASTIHSFLHLGISSGEKFEIFDTDIQKISNATVFIDETSMLDIWTADKVFESIGNNTTLVFVGDIDQLPSVGPGAILRDIIDSGAVPFTILNFIHRQGKDEVNICENADNIKHGICSISQGEDFIYTKIKNLQEAQEQIISLYVKDVAKYGLDNVKCLCPYKKGSAGMYEMNKRLAEIINPRKEKKVFTGYNEMNFCIGDPVMQLKNIDNAANGDIGTVISITDETMIVVYNDGEEVEYDNENKKDVILAYAITVHKSQGSEFDSVFVPLSWEHRNMKKRNLLYTAITRGKKIVHLYSNDTVLAETINNNVTENRNSLLKQKIRRASA